MLGHKQNLDKFERIEIVQNRLSDHNGIQLEIKTICGSMELVGASQIRPRAGRGPRAGEGSLAREPRDMADPVDLEVRVVEFVARHSGRGKPTESQG